MDLSLIHIYLTPKDALLVISNSGTSRRLQALAKGAKENGAKIIIITNNGNSPLAQLSEFKLITATREKLLTGEFWFSRITAMMVVEILYLFLFTSKMCIRDSLRREYFQPSHRHRLQQPLGPPPSCRTVRSPPH